MIDVPNSELWLALNYRIKLSFINANSNIFWSSLILAYLADGISLITIYIFIILDHSNAFIPLIIFLSVVLKVVESQRNFTSFWLCMLLIKIITNDNHTRITRFLINMPIALIIILIFSSTWNSKNSSICAKLTSHAKNNRIYSSVNN